MIKKRTRIGKSVAIELSANGRVLVVTAKRNTARERRFRKSVEKINQKYAALFHRLSE
jgi:hypothetical protein